MASGQTTLRRTSLGLQISQELRRQILFGHLNPGTPLTQQDLCERFGTSRMPVRDAINMLVMDGLATRPNNRDAVVADITLEDILDAFKVNAHLHALAAVRATTRGTPDERNRLQNIHDEMGKAIKNGDLPKSAELNGRFHRQLNRMSHSNPIINRSQTGNRFRSRRLRERSTGLRLPGLPRTRVNHERLPGRRERKALLDDHSPCDVSGRSSRRIALQP